MRKALRILMMLCVAGVIFTSAGALANAYDEGLMPKQPIEGTAMQPESADASQAAFLLRYQYPQFVAQTEADEAINRYYQHKAEETKKMAENGEIRCEVAHSSARYLSVRQLLVSEGSNGFSETLSADTFARDGMYAGQKLTLSMILGLEQENAESSMAETLVYDLVWQIVHRGTENAEGDYLDGLTKEDLMRSFKPETDFYLDADGNLVFFIQSGEIAGEIAGILEFPFAPAEILSAF